MSRGNSVGWHTLFPNYWPLNALTMADSHRHPLASLGLCTESLQNSTIILANSLRWVGICRRDCMFSLTKICCYLFWNVWHWGKDFKCLWSILFSCHYSGKEIQFHEFLLGLLYLTDPHATGKRTVWMEILPGSDYVHCNWFQLEMDSEQICIYYLSSIRPL